MKGTVEGERAGGRVGRVQLTANQGQEWTGIRATAQGRDFQVSKKGVNQCRQTRGKKKGGG